MNWLSEAEILYFALRLQSAALRFNMYIRKIYTYNRRCWNLSNEASYFSKIYILVWWDTYLFRIDPEKCRETLCLNINKLKKFSIFSPCFWKFSLLLYEFLWPDVQMPQGETLMRRRSSTKALEYLRDQTQKPREWHAFLPPKGNVSDRTNRNIHICEKNLPRT